MLKTCVSRLTGLKMFPKFPKMRSTSRSIPKFTKIMPSRKFQFHLILILRLSKFSIEYSFLKLNIFRIFWELPQEISEPFVIFGILFEWKAPPVCKVRRERISRDSLIISFRGKMAEVQQHVGLPSGYEYDFVSTVFDEYHCLICQLPLREPVLTRCGHRYCKRCLNEAIKR